jgi:hypothetical protein
MRPQSRAYSVAFRRAVWASLALHAFAGVLTLLFLASIEPNPAQPGIDTHAASEAQVRMHLTDDPLLDVVVSPPTVANVSQEPVTATPSPEVPALLPAKPFAPVTPRTLPAELVVLLRKPVLGPVGPTVVEIQTPPGTLNPPTVDPNVSPTGGVPAPGTSAAHSAPAIHGALKPGQTVVYVLDCSGSMGASGKFDAASASLLATLKLQPATVRFQIVVYSGESKPLLVSDGNALPASAANVQAAAEKLAHLEPRGKSNHLDAIRVAIGFHPDVILMLTDADDLSAAALKPVLASASKVTPVRIGQVTPDGVQTPRELK